MYSIILKCKRYLFYYNDNMLTCFVGLYIITKKKFKPIKLIYLHFGGLLFAELYSSDWKYLVELLKRENIT